MYYSKSVSFIETPITYIDFCMHNRTCVKIQNTITKLVQFRIKHSKLVQLLHVDKTYFFRPNHIAIKIQHIANYAVTL